MMQEEHQRTVEMLQRNADMADNEICQLQNRIQSMPTSSAGLKSTSSAVSLDESRMSPVELLRDPRHEERQSGEVMRDHVTLSINHLHVLLYYNSIYGINYSRISTLFTIPVLVMLHYIQLTAVL